VPLVPTARDLRPWHTRNGDRHLVGMDHADGLAADAEFIRLSRAESLRVLGRVPVGRLIFTLNALPTVRPMNFALVDGLILVRTSADTTVGRKVHDTIVAFEVDELDAATASGWSVTVTGRAALVTDPGELARYRAVPLAPWAPGIRDQFVTITTELVQGQRISRPVRACPGRGKGTRT
jgi:hypothetical protein